MSPLGDSEYIQNISYLNWFFSIDCCSNSLYFVYIKHYKVMLKKHNIRSTNTSFLSKWHVNDYKLINVAFIGQPNANSFWLIPSNFESKYLCLNISTKRWYEIVIVFDSLMITCSRCLVYIIIIAHSVICMCVRLDIFLNT